ncbi:MAG: hypothetical protein HOP12_13985 [Candidatus Eisenbacteria bacterium]|uniref:Tail specific protease domain-containing protein n=1 Tax=Eiseniibacteriota bacterium TaxID=2212470 RepID=A0A849T1T5_UNCEI|nr:hypothetical protein [Candidatus Eisenbacteria bacterium]
MPKGSAHQKRVDELVERMEREPGQVIATDVSGGGDDSKYKPSIVYPEMKHFAMLMDHGTESAAEAFVMSAWPYDRVTLFGENSGGTIDYQSVAMVPLACTRQGLYLGYPTLGSSEFLPRG